MRGTEILRLLLVTLVFTKPVPAFALSNVVRDTALVRILSFGPDASGFEMALDTLTHNRIVLGEPWNGDHASDPWTRCHHNVVSAKVHAVAKTLLETRWGSKQNTRRQICELAASHGVRRLDTLDVFLTLIQDESRLPYESLAILRDKRTASVLAKRLRALSASNERAQYPGEAVDITRCLYHMTWYAAETADSLLVEQTDPSIRSILQRIIAESSLHREPEREMPAVPVE